VKNKKFGGLKNRRIKVPKNQMPKSPRILGLQFRRDNNAMVAVSAPDIVVVEVEHVRVEPAGIHVDVGDEELPIDLEEEEGRSGARQLVAMCATELDGLSL